MKTFYRNRLPHLMPLGGTFFITFRLADALPQHILADLIKNWEAQKREIEAVYKSNPFALKKALRQE